jgi:hypothetical protein
MHFAWRGTRGNDAPNVKFLDISSNSSESNSVKEYRTKHRSRRAAMKSYSFALTSPSGPEQLYRIGQFPDLQHAFCLAELIASELSIDENGPWFGWTVEVRDCAGSLIRSVPVGHGEGSLGPDSALAGNRLGQLELSH